MTQHQRRRRGRIALLVALAAGIAVADQVTKYLAEANLTQGVIVPLLGDLLGLQLIYNPGAAFSLATGMTWIFTLITIGVVVVVVRVSRRLRSTAWAVALGLLLGGALGNLYDRLLREPGFGRGHVVDFINYNGWFVGNVADIAIVAAAVLIAVLALVGLEVDGTRAVDDGPADDPGSADDEEDEDLDETPLAAEDEFSPDVPRAEGEDVDVAAWVAQAPAAGATPAPLLDDDARAADDTASSRAGERLAARDAATVTTAPERATDAAEREADAAEGPSAPSAGTADETVDTSGAEPGPDPALPSSRRSPRSRREARLASDDDA
ncbi:MAG TPA: signal peptidase II [Phototrophicaceae bacterium]|nr:signal peptidase II [Phototrophicaceae bacterium]